MGVTNYSQICCTYHSLIEFTAIHFTNCYAFISHAAQYLASGLKDSQTREPFPQHTGIQKRRVLQTYPRHRLRDMATIVLSCVGKTSRH